MTHFLACKKEGKYLVKPGLKLFEVFSYSLCCNAFILFICYVQVK